MRYIIFILLLIILPWQILAKDGIKYENIKEDNHNYHILTIDPSKYKFQLVKAHNGVMGRETLDMIAKRRNAVAAINAGFFEIAGSEDGRPSGALIIDGQILGISKGIRALAILHDNKFHMEKAIIDLSISVANKIYKPNQTNIISNDKDVILYSHLWGITSLTDYHRKEILINSNMEVEEVVLHGDNIIPNEGYILSFPKEYDLSGIDRGQKVKLSLSLDPKPTALKEEEAFQNMVTGIPLLVKNGEIPENIDNFKSSAFTLPYARTALGVKDNGEVVMLVVEHEASHHVKNLTIDEARNVLQKSGYKRSDLENMEYQKVLGLLQMHISSKSTKIGLTLKDLAQYMLKLGCKDAINFDGGGSSTIFYGDKIVNATIGDEDESAGQNVVRPISDAIIVLDK